MGGAGAGALIWAEPRKFTSEMEGETLEIFEICEGGSGFGCDGAGAST